MTQLPLQSIEGKWTFSVAITLGEADESAVAFHDGLYLRIDELLKGRAPLVKTYPGGIEVTFGVSGADYLSAQRDAKSCIGDILDALDVQRNAVSAVRMTHNRQLAREFATLPSGVGVGEVAELLGVSKQRVAQLSQRTGFPRPVYRLRATPVWIESEIREYAESRNTRPGRVSSAG